MKRSKPDAITRLRQLLRGGKLRHRAIAEKLNAEGFKTPRGKKWKDHNVQNYVTTHKDELKFMGTEPLPTETPIPLDDAPPMELPAISHHAYADVPFVKYILDSRELTDAKKIAILKILF